LAEKLKPYTPVFLGTQEYWGYHREIILGDPKARCIAEIAGDKLLYTTGVLATRYRALPILCGMTIAFTAKTTAPIQGNVCSGPIHFIAAWKAFYGQNPTHDSYRIRPNHLA